MPTLMDALASGQNETAAAAATGQSASTVAGAGPTSSTSKLGQLLSAKQGVTSTGPGIQGENLLESAAGADTKQAAVAAGASTANDVQAQRIQAAGQQMQQKQAAQAEQQAAEDMQSKFATSSNQILANLAAGEGALGLQKNQAQAEQLGFQMRLSNDQYVTRLNEEAEARRLNDASSFQEQLAKSTFGSALSVLQQRLGAEAVQAQDAVGFQSELSKLNMQDWLNIQQYGAKSAAGAATAGAVGGVVSGAAKVYSASDSSQPAPDDTQTSGTPLQSAQNPETPAAGQSGAYNPMQGTPFSSQTDTTPAYTSPGGNTPTQAPQTTASTTPTTPAPPPKSPDDDFSAVTPVAMG